MKIRQSELSAFQRCAQQSKLYREAEQGGVPRENLSTTVLGTVVHYVLMIMEQLHHQGREDALAVAESTFLHYWHPDNLSEIEPGGIDVWLPRTTYGGLRDRGLRGLRDYYATLVKDDGILLALEHTFTVPIVIDDEPHELHGTVDRLALRFYKRKPILSIEDFKVGKKPTYLRYATQWTLYGYASRYWPFWEGFNANPYIESDPFEELLRKLNQRGLDLFETKDNLPLVPRRGRWLSLTDGFSSHDAGWRTEHDYARLEVHLREYIKARRHDVYPLTVDGHICTYCPFSRNGACGGVPVPELDSGAPA